MFYYKFTASTCYCGTDHEEYHKFETKPTQDTLCIMAEEIAHDNAEQYEYLATGWDDDEIEGMSEDEVEEILNNYYADAYCSFEEVTQEEYEENC